MTHSRSEVRPTRVLPSKGSVTMATPCSQITPGSVARTYSTCALLSTTRVAEGGREGGGEYENQKGSIEQKLCKAADKGLGSRY